MIPNRIGIEQRPSIAEEKTQIGHWEGDTIIGGNHLGAIATHVDKTSEFLILLIYRHGLSRAEAAALKWEQIDLNNDMIHVRRVKQGTLFT